MHKEYTYYVYILASQRNGTLYIGVTNSLLRRTLEHKFKVNKQSFTDKYDINILVYYETYQNIEEAIQREKQFKKWNRQWKIKIIEEQNPTWRDMFIDME
jgi:putative endonuclease